MTAATMIKHLQALPPDTEVAMWNGLVEDYQELYDPVKMTLRKRNRVSICNDILMDAIRTNNRLPTKAEKAEAFKKAYTLAEEEEFDTPNMFMSEERLQAYYPITKEIYIFNAKPRGKRYSDRIGSIEY